MNREKELFGNNPDKYLDSVIDLTETFAEKLGQFAAKCGVQDMSSTYMLVFTRIVGASVREEDAVITFAESWLEYLKASKEDGELEKFVASEEEIEEIEKEMKKIQDPDYIG